MTATEEQECLQFLERVLDAYKTGIITRESASGGLQHVMAAFEIGNAGGAWDWIRQDGVSYFISPIYQI